MVKKLLRERLSVKDFKIGEGTNDGDREVVVK